MMPPTGKWSIQANMKAKCLSSDRRKHYSEYLQQITGRKTTDNLKASKRIKCVVMMHHPVFRKNDSEKGLYASSIIGILYFGEERHP